MALGTTKTAGLVSQHRAFSAYSAIHAMRGAPRLFAPSSRSRLQSLLLSLTLVGILRHFHAVALHLDEVVHLFPHMTTGVGNSSTCALLKQIKCLGEVGGADGHVH
ncbi:hypothetical protein [Dactylosporangium sp. CA-233914]|uniref:hypothetical protein n=1 Tax=Dactylosporangium sp. CA-233914 TaxID=3239934 RepID=UPI003D8E94E9